MLGLQQLEWRLRTPIDWLAEIRALRAHVTPATPLYADALSLRAFEFFASYPQHLAWRDLSTVTPADIPANSFVLIYPPGIVWLEREAGIWVAWPAAGPTDPTGYLKGRFSQGPPPSWTTVWRSGDVNLYHVDSSMGVASTGGPQ